MASLVTLTAATSVLTSTGVFTNTQTVVCGGKTYTTQTSLTNSDGNVAIGADAATTLQNLKDAINLTGTPGTQYATLMTINPEVGATDKTATTLKIVAKAPGTIANTLGTTETQTNASWTSTVMAGGVGNVSDWATSALTQGGMNSDVLNMFRQLTAAAD
jgi:hypothetical protein